MSYTLLDEQVVDHGICLIDVYSAPGDLYDSWDIVKQNPDGTFPCNPDAGYGPDARDRDTSEWTFEPVHVVEYYERWDEDGWTKSETIIQADGQTVARRGN